MHAAGGEDVVMPLRHRPSLRRQAYQGEVRGAAADIDDQHQFFAVDARLVVEGCGNRFVLEGHVLEAELVRHRHQGVLRLLVGLRIVVDEEHRASQYHFLERSIGHRFGALLQLADKEAEQVLERQRAAQHRGFAFQQLGAEQAFQGAHQPAFVAFQVFLQGQAAIDRAAFFEIEEDDRGQGDLAVFQLDQGLRIGAQPADGGVGGAEVDAAGAGGGGESHATRCS
ncbi:hypothetical protein FQZ97_894640 [compost metagenome]